MNRHLSMPPCDQFVAMHLYPHQLDEQLLCTTNGNSTIRNRHLSMSSYSQPHSFELDESKMFRSTTTNTTSINRHLSIPSCTQFIPIHHHIDEEQPLRIHVGNIPFLWTIDDLRKQFLVFGPVKDPEIVSNERGSKGFGFITFLRYSDGMNAIRVKNGSIADGRKITVALASSRAASRINSNHCCCCNTTNNSNNFV